MTAFINKRQQARNERALQDLLRTVPGNDRCADCMTRNPGWASWSLGIFLCIRCAALHRKLGTHISKVKSLSMDSWSTDQVENLKLVGNVRSNQLYNPRNQKPSIPLDADEVDGVIERFIRQKYQQRSLMNETPSQPAARHNTGSTSSNDDPPPPLPPKPTSRFTSTLRAASATFPLSRDKGHPPLPTQPSARSTTLPSLSDGNELEQKLAALREMGFPDDQRNAAILRGLNGNVEKTVEALVRLGEGGRAARAAARGQSNAAPAPQSTPQTAVPSPLALEQQQLQQSQQVAQTQQPMLSAPLMPTAGQQMQMTNMMNLSSASPAAPQAQGGSLEGSFQSLQVSQQPLFPNNTGGWTGQNPYHQTNPFLKTFTPPISQSPHQTIANPTSPAQFVANSPAEMQPHAGNPFLRSSRSQTFSPSNPFLMEQRHGATYPPVFQQEQAPPMPHLPSWVSQQQQQQHQPQLQQSQAQQPSFLAQQGNQASPIASPNPFLQQIQQPPNGQFQQQQQQQYTGHAQQAYEQGFGSLGALQSPTQMYPPAQPMPLQYQQAQPLSPQQTGRYDKNSILALYNYPQLAPQKIPDQQQTISGDALSNGHPHFAEPRRSATMPIMSTSATTNTPNPGVSATAAVGSRNPFASNTATSANPFTMKPNGTTGGTVNGVPPASRPVNLNDTLRQISRESVDFVGLMNGRHSPDAFAGLSARYG